MILSTGALSEYGLADRQAAAAGERDKVDMTRPFGGSRQSRHARDKCIESLPSFTQDKSAWIRHSG